MHHVPVEDQQNGVRFLKGQALPYAFQADDCSGYLGSESGLWYCCIDYAQTEVNKGGGQ